MKVRENESEDLDGSDELIVVGLAVDVEVGARDLVGSLGEEGEEGREGRRGDVGFLFEKERTTRFIGQYEKGEKERRL